MARPVLIVPAAGRSTRFGLSRPKFLLQHPDGETMLTAGLRGVTSPAIEGILVVTLAQYLAPHSSVSEAALRREMESALGVNVELLLLDEGTNSQVETVGLGVESLTDDPPVVIKDSDNYIGLANDWWNPDAANFVTYGDLRKFPDVKASNKSFVTLGAGNSVIDIVEKDVVSSFFNVGLLGFGRASQFVYATQEIEVHREAYMSDVLAHLMSTGMRYQGIEADQYHDWGDLSAWNNYRATFATVFCDLDGVLCRNVHPLDGKGGWSRFEPIQENIDALQARFPAERTRLVFTTSRTEDHRSDVETALQKAGFGTFDLVMGLPHARRVLINDFSDTSPYPTATAINLPRDDSGLVGYL